MNDSPLSWQCYFMAIAKLSALRSKDPKTKNGACIVGPKNKIIGIGYNGLPRGLDDDNPQYWQDIDTDPMRSKHTYVVHAEQNAIYNSINSQLDNAAMYATQFPCTNCAKAIIQVGITHVIYLHYKPQHADINTAVQLMLADAGVSLQAFADLDISDSAFLHNLDGGKAG